MYALMHACMHGLRAHLPAALACFPRSRAATASPLSSTQRASSSAITRSAAASGASCTQPPHSRTNSRRRMGPAWRGAWAPRLHTTPLPHPPTPTPTHPRPHPPTRSTHAGPAPGALDPARVAGMHPGQRKGGQAGVPDAQAQLG